MSVLLVLGIGVVGGLGAVARFALDGAVSARVGREFPWGTLVVNLVGAFLLGVIVGASAASDTYRLVGTGLIGAFTTFSTWIFESHRLAEDGQLRAGILNLALSLVLGLAVTWAGRVLGGWL
jgi:fluoride exporter